MQQTFFLTICVSFNISYFLSNPQNLLLRARVCGWAGGWMGVCVVCFLIHTEGSMRKWLCVFRVDHWQCATYL